jgi:hypothetical protein
VCPDGEEIRPLGKQVEERGGVSGQHQHHRDRVGEESLSDQEGSEAREALNRTEHRRRDIEHDNGRFEARRSAELTRTEEEFTPMIAKVLEGGRESELSGEEVIPIGTLTGFDPADVGTRSIRTATGGTPFETRSALLE